MYKNDKIMRDPHNKEAGAVSIEYVGLALVVITVVALFIGKNTIVGPALKLIETLTVNPQEVLQPSTIRWLLLGGLLFFLLFLASRLVGNPWERDLPEQAKIDKLDQEQKEQKEQKTND